MEWLVTMRSMMILAAFALLAVPMGSAALASETLTYVEERTPLGRALDDGLARATAVADDPEAQGGRIVDTGGEDEAAFAKATACGTATYTDHHRPVTGTLGISRTGSTAYAATCAGYETEEADRFDASEAKKAVKDDARPFVKMVGDLFRDTVRDVVEIVTEAAAHVEDLRRAIGGPVGGDPITPP